MHAVHMELLLKWHEEVMHFESKQHSSHGWAGYTDNVHHAHSRRTCRDYVELHGETGRKL